MSLPLQTDSAAPHRLIEPDSHHRFRRDIGIPVCRKDGNNAGRFVCGVDNVLIGFCPFSSHLRAFSSLSGTPCVTCRSVRRLSPRLDPRWQNCQGNDENEAVVMLSVAKTMMLVHHDSRSPFKTRASHRVYKAGMPTHPHVNSSVRVVRHFFGFRSVTSALV